MKNLKVICKENLFWNLQAIGEKKKVCAMVKSNAYGHGLAEIVPLIEDRVECFGVVNVDEGRKVRRLTDKKVIVCAKTFDFKKCATAGLEVFVDEERDILTCAELGIGMHLKLDCGMNRFGVKSKLAAVRIDALLQKEKIKLKSICTHFPNTENWTATIKNHDRFLDLRSLITQDCKLCFGGSGIVNFPFQFDMLRLGIGMYGYGQQGLKPVMQIRSYVSKIFFAKSGDFVGYGKKYKVKKDGFFAIVPVGYGDGLRRGLSGRFLVKIAGKNFHAVGNICMDAFFVRIDENVKVGDEVVVMQDAEKLAKKIGTISYEILTGFSNFRGKTIII